MEQQSSVGYEQQVDWPHDIQIIRQDIHKNSSPFMSNGRVANYGLAETMAYKEQPYIETAIKNLKRMQKLHVWALGMPLNRLGIMGENACFAADRFFFWRARASIKLGEVAAAGIERDFLKRLI
jgi:hypothetical protein